MGASTGTRVPAQEAKGRKYALLVGVREYSEAPELRPLKFAERDVAELAAVLRRAGYRDEDVLLMTQSEGRARTLPLRNRILKELRLLLAAVLALAAQAPRLGPVAADHGGREITAQFNCNRPVNPPRCTSVGDNPRHLVFFDARLTPELADALRRTMAEDYGPTKLVMIEQARLTRMTDVIAFSADYGDNGAAGWVYCPPQAPQGLNARGDRWCQQQELHFNLNPRFAAFTDDDASRAHVACHELGHTIGLRHWGNPPNSVGPAAPTCMHANTPNGPTELHQIDRDHIDAYPFAQPPVELGPHRFRLVHAPNRFSDTAAAGAAQTMAEMPAHRRATILQAAANLLQQRREEVASIFARGDAKGR